MLDNIYYTNNYLVRKKPKLSILPLVFIILLIVLTILSLRYKAYDIRNITGYLECDTTCKIEFKTDIKDTNKYLEPKYIVIKKLKKEIKKVDTSEILTDNNTLSNYQIITYEIDKIDLREKMFYEVKIFANEDIVFQKIIDLIFKEEQENE